MSTAWIFPGHGAQYPGMGRSVLGAGQPGSAWLEEAEAISGLPLARLVARGPRQKLADPRVVEPLLAAVASAHADRLRAEEGPPAAVAGHSAGHIAALYASGAVDRSTCLRIACRRGAVLAEAAASLPGGMMAAHGLPNADLARLAAADPEHPAGIAARNAADHVVLTGSPVSLARAAARLRSAGASVAALNVAGPWHSAALAAAAGAIARAIADLPVRRPDVPVWNALDATSSRDPDALRHIAAQSVASVVEWHATTLAMHAAGIGTFVEAGAGRTLWGLIGRMSEQVAARRRYVECERSVTPSRLVGRPVPPPVAISPSDVSSGPPGAISTQGAA